MPKVGIEPTHLSVLDFESGASISLSHSSNLNLVCLAIMPKKLRQRNDHADPTITATDNYTTTQSLHKGPATPVETGFNAQVPRRPCGLRFRAAIFMAQKTGVI